LTEIEQRVAALFREMDRAWARGLEGKPTSCARGCAHCCYQMVGIGIGEAFYIAAEIARRPGWKEWAQRLFQAAREQSSVGRKEWFGRHVPCPFLVLGVNECGIYERRPAACRYYHVRSPADNCALGAKDSTTERYDARETLPYLNELDAAIWDENPQLGERGFGTLPHLVLHALPFCLSRERDVKWAAERAAKLPSPSEWTREYARFHREEP
jgi:Fe-S-cluster containining protein